jgi:hypothetical protein
LEKRHEYGQKKNAQNLYKENLVHIKRFSYQRKNRKKLKKETETQTEGRGARMGEEKEKLKREGKE